MECRKTTQAPMKAYAAGDVPIMLLGRDVGGVVDGVAEAAKLMGSRGRQPLRVTAIEIHRCLLGSVLVEKV